jgi:neurofibromin 1
LLIAAVKDVSVPLNPASFIVGMSQELARTEPQLTFDFLTEFFVGWDSFADEQKPLSLAYMAPWLSNLRTTIIASDVDGDKAKDKIATLFRKLIDIAITDHFLAHTLEHDIWPSIASDELIIEIFMEELTKAAMGFGFDDEPLESLASIVAGVGTISLRAKIISRLRKALNRTSLRPTKHLPDNAVWAEICVLLHFCLTLSFDNGVQSQLYLPEIFHIVTMLANTGTVEVRVLIHRLLVNTVHAACTSFLIDDLRSNKLRASLDVLSETKNDTFPASLRDAASMSTTHDSGHILAATETLATTLFELCSLAAPSVDVSNAWKSRWMSLVASTAFQNNPAIQPRAFTVMGCLAREEVDDDLLYQVLVALRISVGRLGEENNSDMFIAIVTSLSKMMAKLPSASRYGLQLFWLAISLLRLVPSGLFNCTAHFLEAVLSNIGGLGGLRGSSNMASLLLQGRGQLEDAASQLDEVYGIHFTKERFHLAVCACIARGLTDTTTRQVAMRVIATFLEMTNNSGVAGEGFAASSFSSPYMSLLIARSTSQEEVEETMWLAGVNPAGCSALLFPRRFGHAGLHEDSELLLMTAIELVDFQYLEDSVQERTLRWLTELCNHRPMIATKLYVIPHSIPSFFSC